VNYLASARRLGWGVGDQALSSLTNFLMGILVARSVSPEDFGAFSLAFAVYVLALVTSRGLTGEPLLVRHSHTTDEDWRWATASASGLALGIGVLGTIVTIALAVVVRGALGEAFVALAIVFPGLLLQDVWRYAFATRARPMLAFVTDLVWAVVLLPSLFILSATGQTSLAWPILVWGVSALLSALVAIGIGRILPSLRQASAWFRRSRDLGLRYATEALMALAPTQLTLFVLGAVGGLASTGALRGAMLLLGPIQMLVLGINLIGVPEGVRLARRRSIPGLRLPAAIVSTSLAIATLAWGLAIVLLPASIGEKLLGASWATASVVILPMTIAYGCGSVGYGPSVGLRVLADARRSLRGRTVDAGGQVTFGILGAIAGGASGAAGGLAVGFLAGSAAYWILFERSVEERVRTGEPIRSWSETAGDPEDAPVHG